MKILILGNSGSGKSTLAKHLVKTHGLAHLDLDTIVWVPEKVAVQQDPDVTAALLATFLATNDQWVVKGCYGELVEMASDQCTKLVFLNPGLDACLAHNRHRPWEPHKYASKAEQDAMLDHLQAWVNGYYERKDACSYHAHRQIFEVFSGDKVEYTSTVDRSG